MKKGEPKKLLETLEEWYARTPERKKALRLLMEENHAKTTNKRPGRKPKAT